MGMDEIAQKMQERASGADFHDSIKFDCGEDGVIVIEGKRVSTKNVPADCIIGVTKDDLEAMMAGELDPRSAFLDGKLRVDGDISVAMRLGQLI